MVSILIRILVFKRTSSAHKYYRPYCEPVKTYIFLKGFTEEEAHQLHWDLRNFPQISSPGRRAANRWRYKTFVPFEFVSL